MSSLGWIRSRQRARPVASPNQKSCIGRKRRREPCTKAVPMRQEETEGTSWAPRECLRNPIPETFEAAMLLDRAVAHHLAGNCNEAARLIRQADTEDIRAFTESLWGSKTTNPDQPKYIRWRYVSGLPGPAVEDLERKRKPNPSDEEAIVTRWGRRCVHCGVPLIRSAVPKALQAACQDLRIWCPGNKNAEQHAAFQSMWLQFDHVVPHSSGGRTEIGNVVVTCAPCNYGKGESMLEELGLIDPRSRPGVRTSWDGLERLLTDG